MTPAKTDQLTAMRVAFLYNEFTEDPVLEADEAVPADSPIVAALQRLGHEVTPIACTLDLANVRLKLDQLQPDIVFNLVESLGGSDAMMAAVPMLLEVMQIPCTGCPAEPQLATASKLTTKERLVEAGMPTPAWITAGGGLRGEPGKWPRRFVVKSALEHSSFQMDAAAVVESASVAEVQAAIHSSEASWKRPFFAEEYIDGREFNLALLGEGPFVLPPAEIDFSAYPTDKPRIVCYRAKCDTSSFEYHHTPRRFDFPPSDRQMLNRLLALSRECWRMFGLRGYARIDFRCDAGQQPWILEINTNPCLLPEAGFAAAFSQAGISYEAGIQRILDDAVARGFSVGRARDYPKSMLKVTAGHEIST